jgi:hypothetical protein
VVREGSSMAKGRIVKLEEWKQKENIIRKWFRRNEGSALIECVWRETKLLKWMSGIYGNDLGLSACVTLGTVDSDLCVFYYCLRNVVILCVERGVLLSEVEGLKLVRNVGNHKKMWRHNTQDHSVHFHPRRENLRSQIFICFSLDEGFILYLKA